MSAHSEIGVIERLLVKHPRDAFCSDRRIDIQWQTLNYTARPDLQRAVREYDRLIALLDRFEMKLEFLPPSQSDTLDAIYTRDAAITCEKGMILCNMSKADRHAEPQQQRAAFQTMGIPIHGAITGDGRIEGGDVAWLNARTLAVGRGYRTNDEGIRQLGVLLADSIDELIVVPLPHWRGPGDVFHLMSIISPIDCDLALVYSPLMSVSFRELLLSRGLELIEVSDAEFETMGCNVLAVAPRKCVMLAGNPRTRAGLESAGVEVHEFVGQEICRKGAGGPTCLTRPITRRGVPGPRSEKR